MALIGGPEDTPFVVIPDFARTSVELKNLSFCHQTSYLEVSEVTLGITLIQNQRPSEEMMASQCSAHQRREAFAYAMCKL